jgi:hypothetical protein
MKKLILLAGVAGLFLVGATVPESGTKEGELSSVVAAPMPTPAAKPAPVAVVRPAPAARVAEARTAYPRCSATVQDRCSQGRSYAPTPQRRIQLASRAGERG